MENNFKGFVWYNPKHDEGCKVGVNWYRNGRMGISFLTASGQRSKESKVVNEDQVEFKYGTLEEQEEKEDIQEESYEDLKKRLQKIREERRNFRRTGKTKKKKKNKKSKTKKKKKKDPMEELKNMDPEILKKALQKGD